MTGLIPSFSEISTCVACLNSDNSPTECLGSTSYSRPSQISGPQSSTRPWPKSQVTEKESGAVTLIMGEGQSTVLAVHEAERSVLSSQTGMSLKLTRLFFSSLRALETQPSTMLRWQEQATSQLLCCKLKCPSADSSPTCSSSPVTGLYHEGGKETPPSALSSNHGTQQFQGPRAASLKSTLLQTHPLHT